MAKRYNVGERYYLPVNVSGRYDTSFEYPIEIEYCIGGCEKSTWNVKDEPDLLLTATEVAENVAGRRCAECGPMYDEVVAERDKLKSENESLSSKNDELETTVSELCVLVDKLRKEMAQREELWDNVSNNNDIAKVNLNRLCKQREILTDRIITLEAELEAERKKNNG